MASNIECFSKTYNTCPEFLQKKQTTPKVQIPEIS